MKKTKSKVARRWYGFLSSKPLVLVLLGISLILSAFFAIYNSPDVASPPCVNADEAAFGYNAYSILKTGADEYGTMFPLRLKSFGDYKMPLYSYLSVPFVGLFGLNDLGIRGLNLVLALLFPFAVYFFAKELFEKEEVGAIAAVLVSASLGKGILERHAHEALLAAFLVTVTAYFFVRFLKYEKYRDISFFIVSLLLTLFTYQSSRLFAAFFFVFAIVYFILKKSANTSKKIFIGVFIVLIGLFALTDIINKPARLENLFLTNTAGFGMKIAEIHSEGGDRLFYNKFTIAIRDVIYNHATYFSPQFLAINGDSNLRFGFPKMAPMTLLEYIFIFIGIYFLFRNRERWRYFILALFFITPLTAALSWAEISLTRAFFLLIPALILSAYGIYNVLLLTKQKKIFPYVLGGLLLVQAIFLYYSWDFYLNHYPKRALVTRMWQCGYKEVGQYVKSNYNTFDKFYITIKHGEPYIFMLYYLQYPPEKYQNQATLSAPDEFGFGQVEKFDKFNFSVPGDAFDEKNVAIIGYPDDFNGRSEDILKHVKKITIGKEDMFWIYENK